MCATATLPRPVPSAVVMEPEAEGFAAGDPEAMGAVFEHHRRRLVYAALRYLGTMASDQRPAQHHDAEDIVQDTFIRVWKARHGKSHYSCRGSVLAWLWGCVRYTCYRHKTHEQRQKRRVNRLARSLDDAKEQFDREPSGGPNPVTVACNHEMRERLDLALRGLIPADRLAVERHAAGFTLHEIGQFLGGVTRERARQRVARGVKRLRTRFVQRPRLCACSSVLAEGGAV